MKRTATSPGIAFDDTGAGEPALLCMPGWCVDRTVFADLVPACAASRRTLAMEWRGHGDSDPSEGDFGEEQLVEDALAVIDAAGIERVVPVALAHSGWVAIELRRRLGERVPAIIHVDWLVLDPPPPFIGALGQFQDLETWEATRGHLFGMWLEGVDTPSVHRLVHDVMGSYDFAMWARAGRAIAGAYADAGNPLSALAALDPPPPVLHLYAQPTDPGFLVAQQEFAQANPWYAVSRLDAKSHFPMLEIPDEMAAVVEQFLGGM